MYTSNMDLLDHFSLNRIHFFFALLGKSKEEAEIKIKERLIGKNNQTDREQRQSETKQPPSSPTPQSAGHVAEAA